MVELRPCYGTDVHIHRAGVGQLLLACPVECPRQSAKFSPPACEAPHLPGGGGGYTPCLVVCHPGCLRSRLPTRL